MTGKKHFVERCSHRRHPKFWCSPFSGFVGSRPQHRMTHTHALLPTIVSEPDLRILGVVSTSCTLDAERHELFVRGLAHKCDRTPSLALIVNVFDAQLSPSIGYEDQARLVAAQTVGELCAPANTSSSSIYTASLPACVRGVSRVRGSKMAAQARSHEGANVTVRLFVAL